MEKLEDIGFYTLSNNRALNSSSFSPLYRCEIILTDKCNFSCKYCRPLRSDIKGTIPLNNVKNILKIWFNNGLKNVRFSGGEPTLYDGLIDLVKMCKNNNVERIAMSTNGSSTLETYMSLINAGVNDLSISLDSGCCAIGDMMAGGIKGSWIKVTNNIKELSKLTYVSVGMVFTEDNVEGCVDSILFADSLGVSDIRVIPSAQYNKALSKLISLPQEIINKYPILKYRINNIKNNMHVRGMTETDSNKCFIVLDDLACASNYHFPCIIYLREGGKPIGAMDKDFRKDRLEWHKNHNVLKDPICRANCLDCLVKFNNIALNGREEHRERI